MSTQGLVRVVGVFTVGLLLAAPNPAVSQATATVSAVFRVSDNTMVGGAWSRLVRNDSGITMEIHTSDLEPGAAYTVWWVIVNNPSACSPPGCGPDDLTRAGVDAAAGYATGHVVGRNGRSNFGAHLNVGDASGFGGGADTTPPPFGPGLLDARGAEVHLIVRTHAAVLPEFLPEQIQSFNAACPPNTCMNRQMSIHK